MLFEATRDSQHAALYQSAAGEMLTVAVDDEAAQAELAGAFRRLEHDRVKSEFEELTASGVRNDRYQELSRRLAELKGAGSAAARPRA
jgi:TusA-related sulfurtransferase